MNPERVGKRSSGKETSPNLKINGTSKASNIKAPSAGAKERSSQSLLNTAVSSSTPSNNVISISVLALDELGPFRNTKTQVSSAVESVLPLNGESVVGLTAPLGGEVCLPLPRELGSSVTVLEELQSCLAWACETTLPPLTQEVLYPLAQVGH